MKARELCTIRFMPYHWVYKENNLEQEKQFEKRLSELDMQRFFKWANNVISVGVASQEGDLKGETKRAAQRAEKLAELIKESIKASSLSPSPKLHILNLGQHDPTHDPTLENTPDETIKQRNVILIGVKNKNTKLNTDILRKCVEQCWNEPALKYLVRPSKYSEYSKLEILPYNSK